MKWASETNENIHFGEKVLRVDFNGDFVVETTKRRITANSVVVAVGTEPAVPHFARSHLGETQFHVRNFSSKSKGTAGKRVVVVGGGQSGAEAFLDLIQRSGESAPREVTWISKRENFFPIDDSPFTNDYFTPEYSAYFYEQNREFREAFVHRNILASDGISEHTLRLIYQRIYALRFIDPAALSVTLKPVRAVYQVAREQNCWALIVGHLPSGAKEVLHTDLIIWATGFRAASTDFLAPLQSRFRREKNEFRIDPDFAVVWDGPPDRPLFLLNAARNQRGLADPNLSLIAWRSQRVVDRIRGIARDRVPQEPSFVSWSVDSLAYSTDLGVKM